MKTVLITIFQAVEAKNILRTNVIKALLEDNAVRVVCLARFPERAEYYAREIPHERITYDAWYQAPQGMLERFFSFLKFSLIKTKTTDLKRLMYYEESGNFVSFTFGRIFNFVFAQKFVRQLIRFIDYRFIPNAGFGALLEKYRPDVVFLAHLFDDVEIALLREAKRKNIPAVGFINSWDKLTARCAVRLLPDTLVVYNDIVKKEAMEHMDMPEERIIVCGIPQYDQYFTDNPVSREEFFRKTGLDPNRKVVLFAPMGRAFSNSDWDMIDMLHTLIPEKLPNAQLYVRFQPNDFLDEKELSRRPWLKYSFPGKRFGTERGGDWDMDFGELRHLTNTLAHSSLLVSYASSMSIDAAIFGKPVININFELRQGERPSKSPTQYYKTDHYQKALESGGIRLVHSPEELCWWFEQYLYNPDKDSAGRERLVSQQCHRKDGKAGECIAKIILEAARSLNS